MSSVDPRNTATRQYTLPPLVPSRPPGEVAPTNYGGTPVSATGEEQPQPLGIASNFESLLAAATPPPTGASSAGGGPATDCDNPADAGSGSTSGGGQSGSSAPAGSSTSTGNQQASVSGGGPRRMNDGTQPFDVEASGARFSFGAQTNPAASPNVTWGDGWKQVATADGTTYMKHSNGARATISRQVKLVVGRPGDVAIVTTPFGKGKKFPDGTILVPGLGKQATPYRIDPNGKMYPLPFGQHTFGGVRVNVLNTSVVHMVGADGVARRYESRGMMRFPRKAQGAAALGVLGGGPLANIKPDQLKDMVSRISSIASAILSQAEGVKGADPSVIAGIRSLLAGLPAALEGAIAGMTHTNGGGGTTKPFTITRAEDLFSSHSTVVVRKPRPGESMTDYVDAVYGDYRTSHTAGGPVVQPAPVSPQSGAQPPASHDHHHST